MQGKFPLIALLCALLSACGIKGPLYLPAPTTTGQPAPGADHNKPIIPPELIPDTPLK